MKSLASKSMIAYTFGLLLLSMAGSLFLAPVARADILTWDWRAGNCGVEPGGILDTYTLPNQPGTEICVIPPSYQFNAQTRLYVGVYIGAQYFGETSQLPDPVKGRCATPATSSTLVRSSTICTVLGGRLAGSISYAPGSGSTSATCTDCADCTSKLSNPAFTAVYLDRDITDQAGNCILAYPSAVTNKIFDCQGHAIDGDDVLQQGSQDYGVYLFGPSGDRGNTVRNCVVSDFFYGIGAFGSGSNTFQGNTLRSNAVGIYVYYEGSNGNLIRDNLLDQNTVSGLQIQESSSNIVIGNRATDNVSYGFYLAFTDYNQIAYNRASGNAVGLSATSGENNVIEHNEFVDNGTRGAELSGYGTFGWNTVCGNGLDLWAATNVTTDAADNNKCDTFWLWRDHSISPSPGDPPYYGCKFACTVPAACGNGVLEPPEQCDDGNTAGGDGCDATCKTEFCGDGILQPSLQEQCDDGNTAGGDGCDATCKTEFCGDGILQPSLQEQCDDGNTAGGDGCDATCKIELPNTPVGSNVQVTDSATGAKITFGQVTGAGTTLVASSETGPEAPGGFRLASDPPKYYQITTTAVFDGMIHVCLSYDPEDVIGVEENLKLLHWQAPTWDDVTEPPVQIADDIICGATESLSPFAVMEPLAEKLEATVDINPQTLNVNSKGNWVTVYIELPEGYDPADIDVSSVRFAGSVPAERSPTGIGDHDRDGTPDRMVKFDRAAVSEQLSPSEEVTVNIQGRLGNGTPFAGTDTIRVIAMH